MRILLDTHILLWVLSTPERLDTEVLAAIESPDNDVLFSAASIWEIAIKAALRRPDFPARPTIVIEEALDIGFTELPVRAGTACGVADLPLLHRDPFDRIPVAQAINEPAVLFTADAQLAPYSELVRPVGRSAR